MFVTQCEKKACETPARSVFNVIQIKACIIVKTRLGLQTYPKMIILG
jgi:hypothetical protein